MKVSANRAPLSDPEGATMSTVTTMNPATEKAIQSYDIMSEK